jgi:galactokinase
MFSDYEHIVTREQRNALYYPDLRAYLRCGDLDPRMLIEMFCEERCAKIILFHDTVSARELPLPNMDTFYVIESKAPHEMLTTQISRRKEELMMASYERLKLRDDIIPKPPDIQ